MSFRGWRVAECWESLSTGWGPIKRQRALSVVGYGARADGDEGEGCARSV